MSNENAKPLTKASVQHLSPETASKYAMVPVNVRQLCATVEALEEARRDLATCQSEGVRMCIALKTERDTALSQVKALTEERDSERSHCNEHRAELATLRPKLRAAEAKARELESDVARFQIANDMEIAHHAATQTKADRLAAALRDILNDDPRYPICTQYRAAGVAALEAKP